MIDTEAVARDRGGFRKQTAVIRPEDQWERRRGDGRRKVAEEDGDGNGRRRRVAAPKASEGEGGGPGCSPDLASAPRRWDSLGSPCPRLCDFAVWVLDRNWAGRRGREAGTRDQVPRDLLGLELELDPNLALD